MRMLVALGGNALLPPGSPLDADVQRAGAAGAASALAPVLGEHQVALTHGNGPQVGLLALQAAATTEVAPAPLDVLVAESEGMIGYILETAIDRLVDKPVLTVLTRTLVRADDPAFGNPTKPIGPRYDDDPAVRRMAAERGWELMADRGGLRRVVPSPDPVEVLQSELVGVLLDLGVTVICAGGGGIPVVEDSDGLRGVEAVVDKDLASARLAVGLDADLFVCLTDVDGVYERWGEPGMRRIASATPEGLRTHTFAAGSMAPKVEAACRFVEATGRPAMIGALAAAGAVIGGTAGTRIVPDVTAAGS